MDAAAAGRLVVTLLFAANALVYFMAPLAWPVLGIAFAIGAAACGYFAASLAEYGAEDRSQLVLIGSIACSVASGVMFLIGALV